MPPHPRMAEEGLPLDAQPEPDPLNNYQRELRRLQEDNPANAAELAVLFGNPEQHQREHDWLMRLHQPRPEDAA